MLEFRLYVNSSVLGLLLRVGLVLWGRYLGGFWGGACFLEWGGWDGVLWKIGAGGDS